MKIAFLFPGQGSQQVGMGKDVFNSSPLARQLFDQADETLGYSLSTLCFEGPESDLRLTYHTQPAILTTSIALWTVFNEKGIAADYVAGHSLGEYSALVSAGAMSFEEAVSTVRARGQYMDEAVPAGVGAMAAVLGMNADELMSVCKAITEEGYTVEPANLNSPGQIVISGSAEGVSQAAVRLKEAGAKRVIQLDVSGPFHSSLMKPAADKLAAKLEEVVINHAFIPMVANVTADVVQHKKEIRENLITQVYSPVRWEESVGRLITLGVDHFVEIGPGNVLTGLVKKVKRDVATYNVNDFTSLEEVAGKLSKLQES